MSALRKHLLQWNFESQIKLITKLCQRDRLQTWIKEHVNVTTLLYVVLNFVYASCINVKFAQGVGIVSNVDETVRRNFELQEQKGK